MLSFDDDDAKSTQYSKPSLSKPPEKSALMGFKPTAATPFKTEQTPVSDSPPHIISSLDPINIGKRRPHSDDIKIIGGTGYDIRQPVPIKYPDVRKHFLNARGNFWTPNEISMSDDKSQWNNGDLTDAEMYLFKTNISYLTASDNLVPDNLNNAIMSHITANEMRQYLRWQIAEECYRGDAEILTPNGWVNIKDIDTNSTVAQISAKGDLTYILPDRITEYKNVANLVRVHDVHGYLDSYVTLDHRVAFKDSSSEDIKIELAKDFKVGNCGPRDRYIPLAPNNIGDTPLNYWQKFLIAYAADGSKIKSHTGKNSGFTTVRFSLKKERKKERLREILDNLSSLSYKEKVYREGYVDFFIKVPLDSVSQLDKSLNWCKPFDLSSPSVLAAKYFIQELGHWDGHFDEYNIDFFTTNPDCADNIQTLCVFAGYKCLLKVVKPKEVQHSLAWRLRIDTRPEKAGVNTTALTKDILGHKDSVYCVSVKTGLLLVRQNGQVYISGNSNHIESYFFILESFGLDSKGQGQIFEMYQDVPAIANKLNWNIQFTNNVVNCPHPKGSYEANKALLEDLISYYIFEYLFFPLGFSQIFALARQGKLRNTAQQYQYIWRDENLHAINERWLILQIIRENPELWDTKMQQRAREIINEAVRLESDFGHATMPDGGIAGLSVQSYIKYAQLMGDNLCKSLNLKPLFNIKEHPMAWLSEYEMKQEVNFFEGRVRDYRVGGSLDWD